MAAGFWSHAGIQPGTPTSKFKPWKRRAWPVNKWSNGNRMLWWAFVGTSCLWLEYGIFSNSIKISDPNIQYPARSHLFRSFPGCFWGSIIFNRSQSQRAQIPRTLSPSLGYFKSLNIRALYNLIWSNSRKKNSKKMAWLRYLQCRRLELFADYESCP